MNTTCPLCERDLPAEAFSKGQKRCRECRNAIAREKYATDEEFQTKKRAARKEHYYENRESAISNAREWNKNNQQHVNEVTRRRRLMERYGVTPEWYDETLKAQGYRCAICPATTPGTRRKYFPVDHDHATGEARGLLCCNCNTGLGMFGDDLDNVLAAAAYLLPHQKTSQGANL